MITKQDLIAHKMYDQARNSFWAFRQLMNPTLKKGWFQRLAAYHLQDFYVQFKAGNRPILVIEAPPQHGKSIMIVDFIAWLSGHDPDIKTIYASFSERLGIRANLRLQRMFDSAKYQKVFPNTQINKTSTVANSGQKLRNREIVEFIGYDGYFRNTTVGGSITGESLDLGVIDDPIKGREAAGSETIRDKTWDWFTDDFFTRFSEYGGLLAILTRWHIDDPIGRMVNTVPGVKVLKFRAIATEDEEYRKAGEALFPEHKSLDFLLERKATMANTSWESLYQQNPIIEGGHIIKGRDFVLYEHLPVIDYRIIYADTAQKTAEHNDYSVLECWGYCKAEKKIYLIDMVRGKWEAPELKRRTVSFWEKHKSGEFPVSAYGALRSLKVEDKASGTGLIQELKLNSKIPIKGIERNKDKYTRVLDVVSYIEGHFVCLPANASFTTDFLAECENFSADDSHQHDDQIDPMCDAITDMLATKAVGFFSPR